MNETEINRNSITAGTENYDLSPFSHENNDGVQAMIAMGNGNREELGPLNEPLDKQDADRRGYARELSPEDYIDRTPLPEEEKRTLGRTLLRIFGKKPS